MWTRRYVWDYSLDDNISVIALPIIHVVQVQSSKVSEDMQRPGPCVERTGPYLVLRWQQDTRGSVNTPDTISWLSWHIIIIIMHSHHHHHLDHHHALPLLSEHHTCLLHSPGQGLGGVGARACAFRGDLNKSGGCYNRNKILQFFKITLGKSNVYSVEEEFSIFLLRFSPQQSE